jgi:hypothetical protein
MPELLVVPEIILELITEPEIVVRSVVHGTIRELVVAPEAVVRSVAREIIQELVVAPEIVVQSMVHEMMQEPLEETAVQLVVVQEVMIPVPDHLHHHILRLPVPEAGEVLEDHLPDQAVGDLQVEEGDNFRKKHSIYE